MSWKGLQKASSRFQTNLLSRVGQIDKTVDSDFAGTEQRYRTLEKTTNALQKESKAYLDSIRAMTAAQARLAETIDAFYTDGSEAAMSSASYKRAVADLDQTTSRELDTPFRTTVLEPIGRLCSYWPEINNAISKRSKKLVDYDAARTKARKLVDKPSEDASKLPLAEKQSEDAREIFEVLNQQLQTELPMLMDLRIPYLDPSFECMIRMQATFAQEGYEKLGGVQRYFADNVREDYSVGALDGQVEKALADMSTLSICSMGS